MFAREDAAMGACAAAYYWLAVAGTCAIIGLVGASAYYFSLVGA
jgi:hypothetical protein